MTSKNWDSFLLKVFDKMLTSAEINIGNRPRIQSFDGMGRPVSFLSIPTLRDLQDLLLERVEPEDPSEKRRRNLKVITMQDIESETYLTYPDPSLEGVRKNLPIVVDNLRRMFSSLVRNFIDECIMHGGTTKIFDIDGREISPDDLLEKYYQD